uniref:ORF2A-2B protein n=1 Tax=Fopius arisanus TaxID=64838 RepID=A0A0C9RC19_9HYME
MDQPQAETPNLVDVEVDAVYNSTVEPLVPREEEGRKWRKWLEPSNIIWALVKLSMAVLSVMSAVILIWRWVLHGLRLAKRGILDSAKDVYSLLDYLSPSEDDQSQEEKTEEVVGIFIKHFDEIAKASFFRIFAQMNWIDWLFGVFGLAVVISGSYLILRLTGVHGRRAVQRLRGIRLESVREGSVFRKAEVPAFQVGISSAGLLSDEHHGYGVRCDEYLVAPAHVIEKDGELMTQALLVGTKGKVLTTLNLVKSRVIDDLVYIYLDQKTWSLLGTSKAKLSAKTVHCHATCTGKNGQSTGRLMKTQIRWMMSYTGSTLPGMSGAAYVESNQVVGFHQGASGLFNVGISSELVCAELRRICTVEASEDVNPDAKVPKFMSKMDKRFWDGVEAMKSLDLAYADDWINAKEIDYTQKLNFDDEATTSRKSVRVEIPDGGVRILKQNNTGVEVSMVPSRSLAFIENLERSELLDRLEQCERELREIQAWKRAVVQLPERVVRPPPTKQAHQCSQCETVCRTEKRLQSHTLNSHPEKQEITKESAVSNDFKKTVKTGSFLEKRSSSPRMTTRNSRKSSSLNDVRTRLPARGESPSGLMASQKNIERLLSELLMRMGGQSLATTQKCEASCTTPN